MGGGGRCGGEGGVWGAGGGFIYQDICSACRVHFRNQDPERRPRQIHIYIYMYIRSPIYMYVCVCVCRNCHAPLGMPGIGHDSALVVAHYSWLATSCDGVIQVAIYIYIYTQRFTGNRERVSHAQRECSFTIVVLS